MRGCSRPRLSLAVALAAGLAWACAELAPPSSDAGVRDGGLFGAPCGERPCAPGEYCLATPVGPCRPTEGGACGAGEEPCQQEALQGCAAARDLACRPLPTACAALPPCPCLVALELCPQAAPPTCRVAAGEGPSVVCPYP